MGFWDFIDPIAWTMSDAEYLDKIWGVNPPPKATPIQAPPKEDKQELVVAEDMARRKKKTQISATGGLAGTNPSLGVSALYGQ